MFVWLKRPCDVERCSSSASIHPSTSGSNDTGRCASCEAGQTFAHRSMCVWAAANERTLQKGMGIHVCTKPKFSITLCQHYTTALVYMSSLPCGLCSIKSDDWLSVSIKRNPILVFSLGTSLEGYWLIHNLINMEFFFKPMPNLSSNSSHTMALTVDVALCVHVDKKSDSSRARYLLLLKAHSMPANKMSDLFLPVSCKHSQETDLLSSVSPVTCSPWSNRCDCNYSSPQLWDTFRFCSLISYSFWISFRWVVPTHNIKSCLFFCFFLTTEWVRHYSPLPPFLLLPPLPLCSPASSTC